MNANVEKAGGEEIRYTFVSILFNTNISNNNRYVYSYLFIPLPAEIRSAFNPHHTKIRNCTIGNHFGKTGALGAIISRCSLFWSRVVLMNYDNAPLKKTK